MTKAGAANEIGHKGFVLVAIIAMQEDTIQYREPAKYYLHQLMWLTAIESRATIKRVISLCQSHGWLEYKAGWKRRPGRFQAMVPPEYSDYMKHCTSENEPYLQGEEAIPDDNEQQEQHESDFLFNPDTENEQKVSRKADRKRTESEPPLSHTHTHTLQEGDESPDGEKEDAEKQEAEGKRRRAAERAAETKRLHAEFQDHVDELVRIGPNTEGGLTKAVNQWAVLRRSGYTPDELEAFYRHQAERGGMEDRTGTQFVPQFGKAATLAALSTWQRRKETTNGKPVLHGVPAARVETDAEMNQRADRERRAAMEAAQRRRNQERNQRAEQEATR